MYNGFTYVGIAALALGVVFASVFVSTSGPVGLILLIIGTILLIYGMTRKPKATRRAIS